MRRIAFCGGGTGGHVMPAVAIIEAFVRLGEDVDPYLLGSSRRGEAAALQHTSVQHIDVYQHGRSAWEQVQAVSRARSILNRLAPDVVVGLGGYASIAGVIAARPQSIPTFLLEQNAVPGRSTSLLASMSGAIFAGLPFSSRIGDSIRQRTHVVGTPVREPVARLAALPTSRVARCNELLVLGGSQGSRVVSEAALAAVGENVDQCGTIRVTHQAIADDVIAVREAYRKMGVDADVRPFFDDIPQRLERGPIVVSRAGGTSLAELACAGVPTILIPHRQAIRDHQMANAQVAAEIDGAIVVRENEVDVLGRTLATVMNDGFRRVRMASRLRSLAKPEAATVVASELLAAFERRRAA